MIRHIAAMLVLIAAAMAAGVALVPGERERWTMMVRDGHNDEALDILDAHYRAGGHERVAALQYYKLLMSEAQITKATQVVEQLSADRPKDVETLALLAKHYGDAQDRQAQLKTLERIFELDHTAKTAEVLLSNYRLDGAFDKEEKVLKVLLEKRMIAAADAERLGLLAFARNDLVGARQALNYFDSVAAAEQINGRLALLDLLVRTGDTQTAFNKALGWVENLERTSLRLPPDPEGPVVQIAEWMKATDPKAARRALCGAEQDDPQLAIYQSVLKFVCVGSEQQIRTADVPTRDPLNTIGRTRGVYSAQNRFDLNEQLPEVQSGIRNIGRSR